MKKLVYLYREFTSFEGSLFKYSLAFSLLLALAPSVLIVALLFKYAYLSEDILLNFILHFIPDNNTEMIDQIFSFFTDKDYNITSFTSVFRCFLVLRMSASAAGTKDSRRMG